MRQVEIADSRHVLGLNYGRIVVENKLNWWWKQPTESTLALVKACEREIAVHAPGLLEEIRGIADACGSDYDLVLATMTVSYWELSACKRLCSDHEIGLCDHGETRSEPFGNIYSWVAELGTCELHVARGRPCESEYQVITLEAPWNPPRSWLGHADRRQVVSDSQVNESVSAVASSSLYLTR